MINIKRPKTKTELAIVSASEHLFEIAAGLFVVMIIGLGGYIAVKANSKNSSGGTVAGLQTLRTDETKTDLLNTIAQNSNYKYFFDALTKTGLYKDVRDAKDYTILVPDDSAFKALGEAQLNALFADKNRLTELLKNHIVSGNLNRLDFGRVEFMRSVSGKLINIRESNLGTMFNDAKLMSSGQEATNGIVYELNSLLL